MRLTGMIKKPRGPNIARLHRIAKAVGHQQCVFCDAPLVPGRGPKRMICRSQDCYRRYARAWAKDHPMHKAGPPLRDVVAVAPSPANPRRRMLWLSCGHSQPIPSGRVAKKPRPRECLDCYLRQKAEVGSDARG